MSNAKYILDANILSVGSVQSQMSDEFIKDHCTIIDEIAYELENRSYGPRFSALKENVDVEVLRYLPSVVDDLIAKNILGVDHGNGDALLIAQALYLKEGKGEAQTMLPFASEVPVIVTDEKAIQVYCEENGIDCINLSDFIAVLSSFHST